jgi:Leucine-rich repeat (LRR) protein
LVSVPVKVDLIITPVNDAPIAISQSLSVTAAGATTITLNGTDVDGDALIYSLTTPNALGTVKLPAGFGTVAGVNTLEYTPKAGVVSDTISFKVKDTKGLLSLAAATVSITVSVKPNTPPTATVGANVTVAEGESVTLSGSGTDPDGDALSYSWLLGGVSKATTANYTFIAPAVTSDQTYTYTFQVSDGKGGVASKEVTVTVKNFAFTDANLLRCFGGTIPSDAALKALTTFTCDGIDLSTADLSQLAQLSNLRTLDLSHTKLSNITGLAGLSKLTSLNLEFNAIASITPLASMTGLTYLNLGFNEISDITALSGMNSLQTLHLDANNITNISPLSGKTTLKQVYLDDNQISSITPLAALNALTHVGLAYNQISSTSALSGLGSLQLLALDANNLTSVSDLAGLTQLQQLYVNGNVLTDASPLAGLVGLQVLELGFNQIASAAPLANLTQLTRLNLDFNNLANVSALSALNKLQSLDLKNNQLVTTAGIPSMSGLNSLLRLDGNRLLDDDISLLSSMGNSFKLRLEDNCLGSIALPSTITVFGKDWQFPAAQCGGTAPVALGKTSEVLKNTATTIMLDASDPNGDALTYKLESLAVTGGVLKAANGTVAALGNLASNELRFEPSSNYLGSGGTFKFSATDANGEKSQVVTIQLRVIDPLLSTCFGGTIPSDTALQNATRLDCVGKNLQDLSALPFYFPKLQTLVLDNNPLADISLLTATNFPDLRNLGLNGKVLNTTELAQLSSNLPALEMLFLDDAQLDNADLVALFGTAASPKWQNMNYLVLRRNNLSDISPLLHMHNLLVLNLDDNALPDIAALSPVAPTALPLPVLSQLSVDRNRLSVIALPRVSGLTYLQAAHNCLTAIPTVPATTSEVYWAGQRALVNGVCPAP